MKRPSSIDELFDMVATEPTTGCWLWLYGCISGGYPICYEHVAGRTAQRLVTRISETLARGPLLDSLHVCHRCDTPQCVNPQHLFRGSRHDNMVDCVSKGRHRYVNNGLAGVDHHDAKLTPDIVLACRKAHAEGATYAELARQYGVTETPMKNAIIGKTWRHV